jgi:diguanylate cyclase (GGDEF)-like protein/PAS domain S-box-containing protein
MTTDSERRILIVDDNPAIHQDFERILAAQSQSASLDEIANNLFGSDAEEPAAAKKSYELVSATQGQEAYEIVRRDLARGQRFALAFVDMRMPPGWDGLVTIEKLWSVDPEIQIVICTAYSDYAWEDILERFGNSDRLLILKKPFDTIEVCQLACALTEKWRLAKHAHLKLCQLQGMVEEQTAELVTVNKRLVAEIAERRRSEEAVRVSETRYALAAAGANDGLWDWDLERNEIFFSDRWKSMLGFGANELGSSPEEWLARTHPDDRERLHADLRAHLEGRDESFCGEYRMRRKDGHHRWMLCRGMAVRDERGRPLRIAGSQTDVTTRKIAEEQLRHDASHDALTGLANRALLVERLEETVVRATEQASRFSVLFLDLDKFKIINDSLGHGVGDKLLVQTAERLAATVRDFDVTRDATRPSLLARIGGDEFVILAEGARHDDEVTALAELLQQALRFSFSIDGDEVFTGVSIGIASSDIGYRAAEDVLRDADTALYKAKAAGRGGHAWFDRGMHEEALTRWRIESELRRGIEEGKLHMVYQPVIDARTGEIFECEALLRWHHPELGPLVPADFIPVAESTGLIVPLGRWAFRAACAQFGAWIRAKSVPEDLVVTVNISAKQLTGDRHLVKDVERTLAETGVPAARLRFEITESAMMASPAALATLREIRALGIRFYLDDFGTGYSSLSYLHRMPIDALKIDGSFVRAMASDPTSRSIVHAISTLGHSLGMTVIAEGVETEGQREALRAVDCDALQGFAIHAPLEADKLVSLVARRSGTWSLTG